MTVSAPAFAAFVPGIRARTSAACLVTACVSAALSGCAERSVPSGSARVFALIDPVPALSLGGPNASGPHQFFRVQNVVVDREDRVWIADGGSGEVRIFDADGSHRRTLGGAGEGPGEFQQIRLLGIVSGDSVVAGDARMNRISVYGPDGQLERTEPLPPVGDAVPRPFDVFPADGTILGQVPRVVQAGSLAPGEVLEAPVSLVRIDPLSGTSTPYAEAAGPSFIWTGRSQVPMPFHVNGPFDVDGERVVLSSGPEFRIEVFEAGELVDTFGVDRPRRPVRAEDVASYREYVRAYIPEEARVEFLGALDHEAVPEWLPAYDRVLVSPGGVVWAQIYEVDPVAAHDWDVYGPDRRFLGQASAPAGLQAMAVTRDRLLGVWRDDLGTEHVRAYRVEAVER